MRAILEGTPGELREFFEGKTAVRLESADHLDLPTVLREIPRITANAQVALRFICQKAPKIGWDAVADHVGVKPKVLSGNTSSIWNSAPSIRRALDRDNTARMYMIDAEDAKVILEGFEKLGL